MKRLFSFVLAVAMAASLTACAEKHTHSAEGWELNAREHWQICECGEAINTAAHSLDENSKCSVCGAEIWDFGDFVDVHTYTQYGDSLRITSYDADGSVASETWSEYGFTADGESYETKNTMIDADGIKYIGEYNEQRDMTAWFCYDADGNLVTEERYEFEYDTEGRKQVKRAYVSGTLTQELIYKLVTEEDGWMNYPGTVIDYHDDGSKTVTEYDENDEIISATTYDAAGNVME